jgi:streptogramin lyase
MAPAQPRYSGMCAASPSMARATSMSPTTGRTRFDGTGIAASFNSPEDVAVDNSGNVYIADTGNNAIRKITATGVVTTIASASGNLGFKLPGKPHGVVVAGSDLYIATDTAVVVIRNRP